MTKPAPKIVEQDMGGKHSFRLNAYCADGDRTTACGYIHAARITLKGRKVYKVMRVQVEPLFRRRGVATALYTAAAREACARRARLASNERNPGAHSHDFWAKQTAKGRVTPERQRGSKQPVYILDCGVTDLSGARRRRR